MSSIPTTVRTTNARTKATWPSMVSMSRRALPIPYSPCVFERQSLAPASSVATLPRVLGASGVRPRSAPDAFACVGSGVCVLDEGFRRPAVHGIGRHAPRARRHLDRPAAGQLYVGRVEDLHQTDDHFFGLFARRVGHDDRELVTAVSGRHVLGADPLGDRLSEHPQDLVAGKMAIGVVHLLEL